MRVFVAVLLATPFAALATGQEEAARAIEVAAYNEVPQMTFGKWPWSQDVPAGWSDVSAMEVRGCQIDVIRTATGKAPDIWPRARVTLDLARITVPDPEGEFWFNWLWFDREDLRAEMIILLDDGYAPEPKLAGAGAITSSIASMIASGAVFYNMHAVNDLGPMQNLARLLRDYQATYCVTGA
jgi:hypothetical protein